MDSVTRSVRWPLDTTTPSHFRETFDEESGFPLGLVGMRRLPTKSAPECRNVLVRYGAHIPRNYRYRDGIRLVFLVLRDHLGDECLGLAGGVLYEMIEVNCQYSDDPGAAFQRWRHDHLNRHTDLELPHVPHLTTVTSTITPTTTLIRWRREHPQRYSTRLSDHSITSDQSSFKISCIRSRKEWVVEHTMYVSSRNQGTRPFRQLNPKGFHELQWNSTTNLTGKLVTEKPFDLNDLSCNNIPAGSLYEALPTTAFVEDIQKHHREIRCFLRKVIACRKPLTDPMSAWLTNGSGFSSTNSLQETIESKESFHVSDWEIPNANFARKFALYTGSRPLPPSIKELPVAEEKAVDKVANPTMQELMYSWRFRGPFTPQLWFDSGLDYRWRHI